MRRSENRDTAASKLAADGKAKTSTNDPKTLKSEKPNHLRQRLEPKPVAVEEPTVSQKEIYIPYNQECCKFLLFVYLFALQVVKDFFGRTCEKKQQKSGKYITTSYQTPHFPTKIYWVYFLFFAGKKDNEKIGGEIWYCFKEGYFNAVRRTVRVKEFLWQFVK